MNESWESMEALLHRICYIPSSIKPTNRHWPWIHSFRFLVSQPKNLPAIKRQQFPSLLPALNCIQDSTKGQFSDLYQRKAIPFPNKYGYFLGLELLELVHCRISQTQVPAQWRSGTSDPPQLQSSHAACSSPQQEAFSLPWDHRIQPLLLKSSGVTLPEANSSFSRKAKFKETS